MALGGTSIFGGIGAVWRTMIGVFMLGMITNGFDLLGVADYWQQIVKAYELLGAVADRLTGRALADAGRLLRTASDPKR